MMKVLIKGVNESNMDKVYECFGLWCTNKEVLDSSALQHASKKEGERTLPLSKEDATPMRWSESKKFMHQRQCFVNLGLSPSPLYKSLSEGSDQVLIECKEGQLLELKEALAGICEVVPIESKESSPASILSLVSLFLDNLLLFYILKLSIYSSDFTNMLGYLFSSSKAQAYFRLIISLFLIVGYYYAFIKTKGAPPIARLLEIRYQKDQGWTILVYSLPLVGLYLISSGMPFGKLLGLAMLSFSLGIMVYSNVKFS